MAAASKVLIVGGGIGGLAAATGFLRQGIEVDLVEINPDHSVYGVGIIQPNNTLRALDRIGLADQCVARGGPFPGWRIFDSQDRMLAENAGGNGASPRHPPVNGITRPVFQEILLTAARRGGANIRVGVSIESLQQDEDGVSVVFTDGGRRRYDILVGCDGIYSKVRDLIFPGRTMPTFSGQAVWRYNFKRPLELEYGEIHYGLQTKVGLVPMAPELMYMFLVTRELGSARPPRARLAEFMRDRLSEYGGRIGKLRDQITDPDLVVYRLMEHLLLPAPWFIGRVVLIGDAAHATTPHLAQGAAMAIEDAVLLSELLGTDGAVPDLLQEFMARRFDRSRYVVESSTRLADWEMQSWAGVRTPEANPHGLMGEAAVRLLEAY